MIRKLTILASLFLLLGILSCTKLNEDFEGNLTQSQIGAGGAGNATALLTQLYNDTKGTFQNQDQIFALWEMTTDELIGPTRGPDWDDNGVWRVLHEHKWDGDNQRIIDAFKSLNGIAYGATDLLRFSPTPLQGAEARAIRALAQFYLLDGWNQVNFREPGESVVTASNVRTGLDALTYIITELETILPTLPNAPATGATKNGARALLMKCYLNKGVIANRATPTFDVADMNKAITYADQIITSGSVSFSSNFFDNFAPNNGTIGKENIWTQQNTGGSQSFGIRSRWRSTMHYKQNPGGWNGFSTLSDLYNKFEATDVRRGTNYPTTGSPANPGSRTTVGLFRGQQRDLKNDSLYTDRGGAPLIFTDQVRSIETGDNLEVTGIRAYKYPIDFNNEENGGGNVDNDYVIFRLGDVLLMKAEAILRGGTGTIAGSYGSTALIIVNGVRTNRGATALAAVTLDNLIDERARELYLESWRRQDLVRFGKFLLPMQEKPATSDPKYLLFAIPNQALAINPNLKQNPGY